VIEVARTLPRSQRVRLPRLTRGERVACVLPAFLVLVALFGPLLAPYDPEAIDPKKVLAGPEWAHPFGFDSEGRDVLSRVLYAYRVSLGVAVASVALAFLVGGAIGLLAGYHRRWFDSVLMRPVDMMLAFPPFLMAVVLIAIVGPGSTVVVFAIAVIYAPIFARVIRSSTLTVTGMSYVDAAKCRGASTRSIVLRHVVPNSVGPALVQASILAGIAIQIEAALSFLGFGAQPPTPSLGVMLSDGRDFLQQAPWAEVFPGLAIALSVTAFLILGDRLRARLDPTGITR
jgi:peptide/nickel transport system permease protein